MSSSSWFRTMLPSDRVLVTSPARIPIKPTILKSSSLCAVPRCCFSSGLHSAGWTSNEPRSYLKLPSSSLKERQIRVDSNQSQIQVDHFEEFNSELEKFSHFIAASWRFVRPYSYSIVYFACGSLCIATRVWSENAQLTKWSTPFKAIILGSITLWSALGFINGINQIYDLESDKVNKPYLPLASGDISLEIAWVLVKSFAIGGILTTVLGRMRPEITFMYCLFLFIMGICYSAPPFRLKRSSASATLTIVAARFLFTFGSYYTSRVSLGLPFEWTPAVAFIVIMSMMNALVCSIIKDIPDIEGDHKCEIHTLASKIGGRNITFFGTGLQLLAYVAAICSAIFMPQAFKPCIMIPAHATMALTLIYQAWMLEKVNYAKEAAEGFYMFLWKLAFAQYITFPFI